MSPTLPAMNRAVQRKLIRERVSAGMKAARKHGTKTGNPIGRPRRIFSREEVVRLRGTGLSIEDRSRDVQWRRYGGAGSSSFREYLGVKTKLDIEIDHPIDSQNATSGQRLRLLARYARSRIVIVGADVLDLFS